MQERLAKLVTGIAIIRVGGATEVEVRERKDRVDDAVHSMRAAVDEGILPGGGVALLRSSKAIAKLKSDNEDQRHGIEIVKKTLSWPARQIVTNAGGDGSIVVGKILDNESYAYGFDAQTGEFGDMLSMGIIDPAKVVRTALQGAASIAGLLITTEAIVAEEPHESMHPEGHPHPPHGGDIDF
jgi:chaperonin GroEL